MTYPPQQPGQSGQQGYPGHRGYYDQQQAHPGGYPGQRQPGPGTPHGGYPPPRPPGPPHNNGKTGVIVGITLTLVLLAGAAVAITGFWAPGYFLSDDTSSEQVATASDQEADSPAEQPPKPSLRTQPGEPAPDQGGAGQQGSAEDIAIVRGLAEDAVTAINTRDEELVRQIRCNGNEQVDLSKLPKDTKVTMLGDPVVRGDEAKVPFEITMNGKTQREPLTANRKNGSWCIG
ncbi:hypothetical protein [Haloechinothrix halophila]|uniref:hypothetical protein n=1 Tax=Haloechinothrix halophila TaxID=1069073 RepID=UPI0004021964|nr:hypothetical protein [Haloechinothrix halophila]